MSVAITRTRHHSSFKQGMKIYRKRKLRLWRFEFKFRINSTLKPQSEDAEWQLDTRVSWCLQQIVVIALAVAVLL